MNEEIKKFIVDNIEYGGNNKIEYYNYIIPKLLSKNKPIFIIETGSMHGEVQGSFTMVLAHVIKNYTGGKLITIDISDDHLDKCKEYTKEYSDVIEYVNSDSIAYLDSLSNDDIRNIDLFYFDSFDLFLPKPILSQEHHLKELQSVYDRLADDVILSIDDNYLPNTTVECIWSDGRIEFFRSKGYILGKGTLVNDFLLARNWIRNEELEVFPKNNTFVYEKD